MCHARGLCVELTRLTAPFCWGRNLSVQSPHFLYLIEVGTTDPDAPDQRILSAWEVAARLSFFLVDGPPDAELRELQQTHDAALAERLKGTVPSGQGLPFTRFGPGDLP